MALIKTVTTHDDLNEEVTEDVQTVGFALDGKDYVIDLGDENRGKLWDALAPYVAAARKVGGSATRGRKPGNTTSGSTDSSREENQKIRTWLKENGYDVSERGRIPETLRQAYADKIPADQATKELRNDELSSYVKDAEPVADASVLDDDYDITHHQDQGEPSDDAVMAWWQSKGYKPQKKVNGLMRSQYKAAQQRSA